MQLCRTSSLHQEQMNIQNCSKQTWKGYKALFDIICHDHLEHDTYTLLLINNRPAQRKRQSISDYFNEYVNDYPKLSIHLTDAKRSLEIFAKEESFLTRPMINNIQMIQQSKPCTNKGTLLVHLSLLQSGSVLVVTSLTMEALFQRRTQL